MKPLTTITLTTLVYLSMLGRLTAQGNSVQLPSLKSNPFKSSAGNVTPQVTTPYLSAQQTATAKEIRIETNKGSFHASLKKYYLNKEQVTANMQAWLKLSNNYTFEQVSERTDDLGFTHINYRQLYKGFVIDGNLVMAHFKNGEATSINGNIAEADDIETLQSITAEQAHELAKQHLKATELINQYPVELVIAGIPSENGMQYNLTYKVRIDIAQPLTMRNVFIDAASGKVLNEIDLIAHADTPGTATTLYSGTQSITCDSYGGGYRLRESARNIQTLNATNAFSSLGTQTTSAYLNALSNQSFDYTNPTNNWTSPVAKITSFTITGVSTNWWYAPFADEYPDLYFKIKDGLNQVIYDGRSSYISDAFPPFTFSTLGVFMVNTPYTIEIWDYDAVGGDDFGGSFSLNTNQGTYAWNVGGNNGSYAIAASNNPALDVHWGMEKTHDYFFYTFSRNSFDGTGSLIKNFVFPPSLTANASAYPPPYNFMQYGTGDGVSTGPFTALDIEGHEFTHMVINYNGNGGLNYQSESGALNESFADIFGACIEFYSGVNPDWLCGEGTVITPPFYSRSMSNPNTGMYPQPDTYLGNYWQNVNGCTPSITNDNCGVHINSGVQNFWFYLLCQGGNGTNDLGNVYSVPSIGMSQAQQIVYRNLTNYLTPNATYLDSYYGSLQAAEDLYGNASTQYNAVRAAWYAVGIGSNPYTYCSGQTWLTAPSGTVTDGSGNANYNDNSFCKWVIAPPGATQIFLNFTQFNLEVGFDTVFIYGGTDTLGTPLTYTGTTLPPAIQTPPGVGGMLVKFKSDGSFTGSGWSFNYSTNAIAPSCTGGTLFSTPTGTFTDGSGAGNYANNQLCAWYIAPPCATSVTLSFSAFNTELGYDGIIVWDDLNQSNMILNTSGTTIPSSITSNTGTMLVYFVSNSYNVNSGFSASYTSTGSAFCSGTTNVNTSDYGTISDGSGSNNYCNNMNCQWLIQPPQATSVTLNFNSFDLEPASSDGQTIYDAVEVYNGPTTASPLLGRFSGSSLPPAVSSTGGSMLVRFYSNIETTAQGWSANYTSTSNPYCNGQSTLTAPSGNFSDGSSTNQYANNTTCSWLIQPPNANNITLSFVALNTEQNNDGVIVYDGANNVAPILGQFSGNSIPSSVTSSGGTMYVEFLSGVSVRGEGFTANYTSTQNALAPVASFSSGITNFCAGTCINFTDNSTNSPTSWSWSFPGSTTPTSTAQNPTNICYNTAGTYNVSLTASNNAGGNTNTVNSYITVNPVPTTPLVAVSPSNSVCNGEFVTLTVTNPCLNCSYSWSPFPMTGTSVQIVATGTYTSEVSNTCGYASSSPVSVTVHPLPPTPTITVSGTLLLSSATSGNQWYLNGALLQGENQQAKFANVSGNYYVVTTDVNGCSSQSATVTITLTNIDNLSSAKSVAVYPNPSTGFVSILFSENVKLLQLELFDIAGRKVSAHSSNDIKSGQAQPFIISEFPDGIYQLRISADNTITNHRLVLRK
jgi:Zn-dependent metalloprotease/PKD repeat protein